MVGALRGLQATRGAPDRCDGIEVAFDARGINSDYPAAGVRDHISPPPRRSGRHLLLHGAGRHFGQSQRETLAHFALACVNGITPRVVWTAEPLLLDAAHIVADKDERFGQPVVSNGIPLVEDPSCRL